MIYVDLVFFGDQTTYVDLPISIFQESFVALVSSFARECVVSEVIWIDLYWMSENSFSGEVDFLGCFREI